MGVYIRGMEMPTRCCECRLSTCYSLKERPLCDVLVEYMSYGEWEAKRLDHCPLVEIPPHGRLIDADALKSVLKWHHSVFIGAEDEVEKAQSDALICAISEVVNAPTIIPASEEGE